jgi:polyphosphate kinase
VAVVASRTATSERLLNRELSWLDYDARVLELAADDAVPLLERVKFCAIFSSMLDEFFAVRVAGLMGQIASGLPVHSPDKRTPQLTLAEIRSRALELMREQAALWTHELAPALAERGIVVGRIEDCTRQELEQLSKTFARDVFPILTPLAVGAGVPFPYISPLTLSLAVLVRDPETGESRFARVKVPESLPRFFAVGDAGLFVPLEDVIAHFLDLLFPEMEIVERAVFRVTRDADFTVSDEADDLLEAVELELRRRRFGDVVRLEVSSAASRAMLERLEEGLGVGSDQVYETRALLDLAAVSQLVSIDRPELKDSPWVPVTRPRLLGDIPVDLFAELRAGDLLVHHPYDSFATSVEAFVRASEDPHVVALKTTVYRTSEESPLVPALVDAAEQGKESLCLVELKARFDERRNIAWSRALEQAGVHVVYGFPNLKIHAKTTLLVRRESDGLRRYVHIGTGNYHALTARLYEDISLFTADDDITADVAELFNYLTGFGRPRQFRKILVAPFTLRGGIIAQIRAVAAAAAAGERARIRLKVNALIDEAIIEELYAASQAGAQVEAVVRGICALRPGVPEMSENIVVRSVLGRFLEHSRFMIFDAGDRSTYLLGSADLMPRNLDHRIEVVVPVEDPRHRVELEAVFDALLADDACAWQLGPDGDWSRVPAHKEGKRRSSQSVLMRRAQQNGRRGSTGKPRARRR